MIERSKNLYEDYKSESAGYKSMLRIKTRILTFANLIEIDLENWTKFEILAAWQYLERTAKQNLTHRGLRNHLVDIRNVFYHESLPNFTRYEKEINLFSNQYINDRIDKADKPWVKRNANRPPYSTWNLISSTIQSQIYNNRFKDEKKRLHLWESRLILIWSRASGARLDELLRMKISDVTCLTMGKDTITYLDLNIRRSKSNRLGTKNLHYKCVMNKVDVNLCPVLSFYNYLMEHQWIKNDGDYIFPSSRLHKNFHVSRGPMTYNWNKICKMLQLPKDHYPKSHSGHDCLLCLAYAKNKNPTEILDITQWNSMAVMDTYIQGPKINGLNVELATTSVEELDDDIRDVLEFNAKVQK